MGRRIVTEVDWALTQKRSVNKKGNFELNEESKGTPVQVFQKYQPRYGRNEGDGESGAQLHLAPIEEE